MAISNSTVSNRRPRRPTRSAPTTAIQVFSLVAALGCATYLSTFFLFPPGSVTAVELLRSPVVLTAFWTQFIGLGGIGMLLPALVGPRLPTVVVHVTAGFFIACAGQALATATVVTDMTLLVTEQQFQAAAGYPLTISLGLVHGVLGLVGFLMCAILGKRRHLFGWGLTALFILAALASPLWHVPPAGLTGSLAVFILARRLAKRQLDVPITP